MTGGDSSTSSPAAPGLWRRRWGRITVAALAVLVGAELGTRILAPHLPDPRTWQSVEAEQKVAHMDAVANRGGAEVVFLGSSVVNAGLDSRLAAREIGGAATVFNAALSAGLPPVTQPWTAEVVLPRLQPSVVVIGVTSFDFYDLDATGEFLDALEESPSGAEALGIESVTDKLERWAGDVSFLWRYRTELGEPKTVLNAIRGRTEEPRGEFGEVLPGGQVVGQQGREGVDPRDVGPPVDDWSLGHESPAALTGLIEEAKRRQIRVVLVDMPVTQAYVDRHPNGEADYRTYLSALRELARREQVLLVEDSSFGDPSQFADQVHLLLEGGRAFTTHLIRELETSGVLEAVVGA